MSKQIFLVNTDLKMDKGKICVQISHGTVLYLENIFYNHTRNLDPIYLRYIEWRQKEIQPIGMMKKVVLKSTESEIRDIFVKLKSQNIWTCLVYDLGLTQVKENSLTCLVVEPLEESKCNELFGHLKLL